MTPFVKYTLPIILLSAGAIGSSAFAASSAAGSGGLATPGVSAPAPTASPAPPPADPARAQAEAGMQAHYQARRSQFSQDRTPREVVMFGDSLTEGTDWQAAFPGVSIANRGIGGDATRGMLQRLDEVTGLMPRKVFVMAGINDLAWYGLPVDEVYDRYIKLIEGLARQKVSVYVMATLKVGASFPADVNQRVTALNARLRQYCEKARCRFIDLNPQLAPDGTLSASFSADQLHLNAAGYAIWIRVIEQWVTPN